MNHYIRSTVLLPSTGFLIRPSAIYQGFLLGMFLNGVTTFGFASILQTATDVSIFPPRCQWLRLKPCQLAANGPTGSPLSEFLTNSITYHPSVPLGYQTVFWSTMPSALVTQGWNGFSLFVDDVERYARNALNYSLARLEAGFPHFFRLAMSFLVSYCIMDCDILINSIRVEVPQVTLQCLQRCDLTGYGSIH